MQYLEHLRLRLFPVSEQDRFEAPYYDYLQAPLQPLMDNLESQTVSPHPALYDMVRRTSLRHCLPSQPTAKLKLDHDRKPYL